MIEFYPSKLDGAPCETYPDGPDGTIESWLLANVPTYSAERATRVSARLNGREVPHDQWATTDCTPADLLQLYAEPKGAELIIAAVTLGAALTFVTGLFAPNIPKPGSQGGPEGERLAGASAKGNQVKLNSPIREVAGRRWIYPDYILPPHRYFVNPRKQVVELLLSVGVGDFQIPNSQILIGDTPAISLGDSVAFAIFGPNQSLASRNEAVWWHSAPEVGATSTGTAGLELGATSGATRTSSALSYVFSGSTVTVPSGAGAFPDDWQPGMIVRIVSPRAYLVTDGGAGRDVISGDLSELAPFAGMQLEIVGDNEGLYTVHSVTAGSTGTASTLTGSAAPSRFDFHVTPASFTITRNGQSWPVNLTTNAVDLAGLVAAVNGQLAGTPFTASSSGGFLRISENLPYSGQAVNRLISDGATTVFGASPVAVTGTATSDAQMTLNFTSGGGAVTGLQTGVREMAIGYAGMRYRLLAASTASITVERLTETGATDGAWPGFTTLTNSLAVITLDETTLEGGWIGPFCACPDGETTTQIEVDMFFPGGLVKIGQKKGDIQAYGVTVEVQYRPANSVAPWVSFVQGYAAATKDQIGFTERINLASAMQPEVRVRRIGAKSLEANVADVVQWYGLRARLSAPTAYPVTTLAITVGTNDTLASQSESLISVRGTRILPTLSGAVQPTRNPADWVRHVAHSVGYSDDDLDMAELSRLHALWAARGDWYDDAREGRTTVFEALVDCLRVGFAVPTLEGGVIRPVRDEPRTVYDDMYSPQNMTGPLQRGFSAVTPDDPDGVDVEFFNETSRQWETVKCRLPGDLGLRAEQLRVPGVTDRTKAWRIGMRRRRELAYRRKTYRFNTEMDALNSGYWGFAALSDDVPGYSQSAQMTAYDPATRIATVTEAFRWGDASHVAAVRKPDGMLVGPIPVTRIDDYRLQFAEPIGFTPVLDLSIEPPHVQFGTTERWSYPALLSDISPRGTTGAAVEAVNYDARVYDDDDNSPPPGA